MKIDDVDNIDPIPPVPHIEDHYDLVDVGGLVLFDSIEDARVYAATDRHLWFLRESDNGSTWYAEGWCGQFVDCAGYCVTTKPRKQQDDDAIFRY